MSQQVQLSPQIEERLVRVLMKRRGIPQEEAELYLTAFKNEGLSDFDRDLARLAQAGPALKGVPQSVSDPIQSVLATRLAYSAAQNPTNQHQETTAERLLAIRAALPPQEDSGVKRELEELRTKLTERDKQDLIQFQKDIVTRVEAIQKQQDDKNKAVIDAIESIKKGGNPVAMGEPAMVTQQVAAEMAKLQTVRDDFLKAMGIQNQYQSGQISLEDSIKRARDAGYSVKGPMTAEEFEGLLNRKLSEKDAEYQLRLAEATTLAKKEAVDSQKTVQYIMAIAQSVLDVLPTIMGPGDSTKAIGVIKGLVSAGQKATAAVAPLEEVASTVPGQVFT